MKRYLHIICILLALPVSLLSQGEIDDQVSALFRNESSFAGFLYSNGFGANYRYGF